MRRIILVMIMVAAASVAWGQHPAVEKPAIAPPPQEAVGEKRD